jgi:hypothetical protein
MEKYNNNRKRNLNKYYNRIYNNKLIKKYFKEKDFESFIIYVLKEYYPSQKREDKIVDKINNEYLQFCYQYNKENIPKIILEIGLIIKCKNSIDIIKKFYQNCKKKDNEKVKKEKHNIEKLNDNLMDFFDIRKNNYNKTFKMKVLPKYN